MMMILACCLLAGSFGWPVLGHTAALRCAALLACHVSRQTPVGLDRKSGRSQRQQQMMISFFRSGAGNY